MERALPDAELHVFHRRAYPTLSSTSFIAAQKSLISQSATENFKKWSHSEKLSSVQVVKSSWSADVEYLSDWMSSRRSWMNGQF